MSAVTLNVTKLEVAGTGLSRATGITVFGWARMSAFNVEDVIFDIRADDNGNSVGLAFYPDNHSVQIYEGIGGNYTFNTGFTSYTIGDWICWAVVWQGTTATVYLSTDGTTWLTPFTLTTSSTWALNYLAFGNDPWDEALLGQLQHARTWAAALSSSDLLSELTSTTPVRTTGLWGSWTLAYNATEATILADGSGNSRNLTRTGAALTDSGITAPVQAGSSVSCTGAATAAPVVAGASTPAVVVSAVVAAFPGAAGASTPRASASGAATVAPLVAAALSPVASSAGAAVAAPMVAASATSVDSGSVSCAGAASANPAVAASSIPSSLATGVASIAPAVVAASVPHALATGMAAASPVAAGSASSVAPGLTAPVVRYYLAEATSGQAPTVAVDSGSGAAYDLPITYLGAAPSFTSAATGRGLAWADTAANGAGPQRLITTGDKVAAAIDGAQKATIEVVIDWGSSRYSGTDGIEAICGIHRENAEGDTFGIWTFDGQIIVSCTGGTGIYGADNHYSALTFFDPTGGDPVPSGRLVLTAVVDYTEAAEADRVKLYVNGVRKTSSGTTWEHQAGNPQLNDALNIPIESYDNYLAIGCYHNALYYTGSLRDAKVYYAAIYSYALSASQSASQAAILAATDDAPTGVIGVGTAVAAPVVAASATPSVAAAGAVSASPTIAASILPTVVASAAAFTIPVAVSTLIPSVASAGSAGAAPTATATAAPSASSTGVAVASPMANGSSTPLEPGACVGVAIAAPQVSALAAPEAPAVGAALVAPIMAGTGKPEVTVIGAATAAPIAHGSAGGSGSTYLPPADRIARYLYDRPITHTTVTPQIARALVA